MASYQWDFSQSVQGSIFSLRIIVDTTTGELSIKCLTGSGDINALWLDYPGGDNTTPRVSPSLNMNGTGIAWDDVAALSNPGLGPAGENKATFITPGETQEYSLTSLGFGNIKDWSVVTMGVRATSVNGGGSVKFVDTTPEPVGPINTPPVISGGAAVIIAETNSPLTTNGALNVTDQDNDTLSASVTGVTVTPTAGVALPGSLTNGAFLAMLKLEFDATDPNSNDGIALKWDFNSNGEAFDFLTQCPTTEEIKLAYAIQVSDGKGGTATQTINVRIRGTNDAPTVNAPGTAGDDLAGAVAELPASDPGAGTATLTDAGSFAYFDLDTNDQHSVAVSAAAVTAAPAGYAGGVLGALTLTVGNSATGDGTGRVDWTYQVADGTIDFLGEGETITQVYTVTVTDACGAKVNQDVTITLTGKNEPPIISIGTDDSDADTIAETNSPLTTAGTLTVTDPNNDTLSASVTGVTVTTTGGVVLPGSLDNAAFLDMLGLEFDSDLTSSDGIALKWDFNSKTEAFDFLTECPATEEIQLVYAIQVSDGKGGMATDTVTVTITGTNDAPTVNAPGTAGDDLAGAVTELPANDPGAGTATLTNTGSFAFFDLDTNDVQTVAVSAAAVTGSSFGYAGAVLGNLTVAVGDSATVDGTGRIDWTYQVDDSAINFIREGETITQVYTVTVTDDCGATVNQDVTITLTGRNENPVAAPDLLYVSNNQTFVNLPASLLLFNDSDDGGKANLTITSITGPLWDDDKNPSTPKVQSVTYNPVTGQFKFVSDAIGVNAGDEGTLTYTVEDSQGGSANGTVTVRLVNTNDGADNVLLDGAYAGSFLALNTGQDRAEGETTVFPSEAQIDYLYGDNGPDKLIGGAGNDVLTGGTGNDEFRMIAPSSNGTDLLIDFQPLLDDDRILLLQGGGGWNAAGSTPAGDVGSNLSGGDYLEVNRSGFAAALKNNKVVELSDSVAGDADVLTLTSANADNAYVLLFNSVSSSGEIWWDDNWSTSAGRLKIATIDSFNTLSKVTQSNQTYFGEWAQV